jgi:hypothetical protein
MYKMARPAETYRGNNASKVAGRGRFTRLRLAAERNEALKTPVPVTNTEHLTLQTLSPEVEEEMMNMKYGSPGENVTVTFETVEESAKERTNRLARERRAAKKLADQQAA